MNRGSRRLERVPRCKLRFVLDLFVAMNGINDAVQGSGNHAVNPANARGDQSLL